MFLLHYQKNENSYHLVREYVEEQQVPWQLQFFPAMKTIVMGDVFRPSTAQAIAECGWQSEPGALNSHKAAVCVVSYEGEACYFASDMSARETLYYYISNRDFILSDTFWGIVSTLEPKISDLDVDALREMIALGGGTPLNLHTPIRGLAVMPYNSLGVFDCASGTLTLTEHSTMQRTPEVTSVEKAAEIMDAAMKDMAASLKEVIGESRVGLGLSGGLDSRTALHYLLDEGFNIACFNTCTPRPHRVFDSVTLKHAKALASSAGISLHTVEWTPASLEEKLDIQLRNAPLCPIYAFMNVYKYQTEGMPDYDFLITAGGGGGQLVGSSAPRGISSFSKSECVEFLFDKVVHAVSPYRNSVLIIRKGLRKFGLHHIDIEHGRCANVWNSAVTSQVERLIRAEIEFQVARYYEKGLCPTDVVMNCMSRWCGSLNRNGAYESMFGTIRNYTIYTPFLLKESLRWSEAVIEQRCVLKKLIEMKMPEFSGIPEEDGASMKEGAGLISKVLTKAFALIRGNGILTHEWMENSHEVVNAFEHDMRSSETWFYELFPALQDFSAVKRLSPDRKNSLWMTKRMVDCIETKKYLNFGL